MDVNVKDPPYNAWGDDIHDDTLAFRNALNAIRNTGGTCFVPQGTYKIAPSGIMGDNSHPALTNDMHLVGLDGINPANNRPYAFLHIHADLTAVIILCRGDRLSIEKIGIDSSNFYGGQGKVPITVGSPVGGLSSNWLIDRAWLLNCGRAGIVCGGAHYQISNCYITNHTTITLANGHVPEGVISTKTGQGLYPHHGKYINNVIDGCSGYDTLGNNHLFQRNHCMNMSFAAGFFEGGTLANATQNTHNTYIGNIASFGKDGPDNYTNQAYTQARGFEIWTPYTLMFNNSAHDNCGGGFALGCSRSVMAFNRSIDNGRDTGHPSHTDRSGFSSTALGGDNGQRVNNGRSIYLGNLATDTKAVGHKHQKYGIEVFSDIVRCVSVIGNNFHGNDQGEGSYRNIQPNVGTDKGRDMLNNMIDGWQRDMLIELLDPVKYTLTDPQYLMLNQLLFGSSRPRP